MNREYRRLIFHKWASMVKRSVKQIGFNTYDQSREWCSYASIKYLAIALIFATLSMDIKLCKASTLSILYSYVSGKCEWVHENIHVFDIWQAFTQAHARIRSPVWSGPARACRECDCVYVSGAMDDWIGTKWSWYSLCEVSKCLCGDISIFSCTNRSSLFTVLSNFDQMPCEQISHEIFDRDTNRF